MQILEGPVEAKDTRLCGRDKQVRRVGQKPLDRLSLRRLDMPGKMRREWLSLGKGKCTMTESPLESLIAELSLEGSGWLC